MSHFLTEHKVPYRADHRETGLSGRAYRIGFVINGLTREGLVQTLSPAQRSGATSMVNATFRLWSDVPNHRWRATVLDDRQVDWHVPDVALLRRVSEVYLWTDRDTSFAADLHALTG